ncbi:MAG TPA: TIR domain-containing protein [Rhizomicrobium sp.]|nr:TIR domain-containing protein [Rhizomicrobium sp.]
MTIRQELSELGSAIAEELVRAREPELIARINALDTACESAARAWSGSNIGYHATVYNAGLQPKSAGMIFSPEWGLMDRWPTHQPDPRWRAMDHHEIVGELLRQANIAELDAIEDSLSRSRDNLSTLREQALSMLSAAVAKRNDEFLSRQLKRAENISITSPNEIAGALLPQKVWSRDSTAMSQGVALAPHQQLGAIVLSNQHTVKELENLERAVRLSAAHLNRMEPMERSGRDRATNVVIGHGSSMAWRVLKDFVKDRLNLPHDEFNRVPVAGIPNTIRLTQMLDGAAIAFVVLTGEDEHVDGSVRARQNVIHEAGLFQGRLGFTKAIVMLEDGCEEFSNIEGLGQIRFPKGNIAAAFEEVRRVLEREGIIAS